MRTMISLLLIAAAAVPMGGIEHTLLHGVSVAALRFTMFPDQVPGLTEQEGSALMQSRLTDARISVTPGQGATLWLNATVFSSHSPQCSVSLEGQLVEEATLARNGLRVPADSWHGGGTALTTTDVDCAQHVRKAIDRAMDDFIEMHRAMNPQE